MPLDTEEARRRIEARWANERGAVGRHVDSVIKRAKVLTDTERRRLAVALVERSTEAQQLPQHVEDPAVIAQVAGIVAPGRETP